MKNCLLSSLVLAIAIALPASQALAKGGHGGGHGGGHHGGGHHGGGHHGSHHGNHHSHHGNHHHHHHTNFAHHGHPFTHGWYGHHAGAWGGWGWGNPWVGAGYGAAATWLGLNAWNAANGGYASGVPVYNNNQGYLTSDQDTPANAPANSTQTLADTAQPPAAAPPLSTAEAAQLAARGAGDLPKDTKFMQLGVFSLAPANETDTDVVMNLAVSKDGILRGTYYNTATDQHQTIKGAIDKKSQRLAFSIAPNSKELYETSLQDLTQETGPVAVHLANGETKQYTIARFDSETPNAADPAAPAEKDSEEAEG